MPTDRLAGYNNGVAVKVACSVTTTGSTSVTLSGVRTIDGIVVGNASERILVRNTSADGIYVADSSSWVRARDCDGNKDILPGTLVYVDRGTSYAKTLWVFNSSSTATSVTVGTDTITLTQMNNAISGVSNWVTTNFFPVVSASSARSVLGAASSTDITVLSSTVANLQTQIYALSTGIDKYGVYNVKSTLYGAVGNGTTNDGIAVQAAMTAAGNAGGGVVYFPPGTYKCSTALSAPAGVIMQGADAYSSVITTTSTSNNIVSLAVSAGIRDMKMTASVSKSAGTYVTVTGNGTFIERCQFYNYYSGIVVGSTLLQPVGFRLIDCNFSTPSVVAAGANAVFLQNYSNAVISKCIITGPSGGSTQPDFGIRMRNGDTCFITDTNVTLHGYGLYVDPQTGQNNVATRINGSLFDSAGPIVSGTTATDSARIDTANGGGVFDWLITNTWFGLSSGGNGLVVSAAAGSVNGLYLNNCQIVDNAVSGVIFTGSNIVNVGVNGGYTAGSTAGAGISFTGGITQFSVIGVRNGDVAGRGINAIGVSISTHANAYYQVIGTNNFGCTTGIIDGATSTNKAFSANLST